MRSLAAVLAVVVVGASLAGYLKYRSLWDGIKRVNVSADLGGHRPPPDPHAMNILVIGSDTRSGVNGKIGGNEGIGGARSDTIMLLHIAPGAHQVVVVSFPRDSVVPILRCTAEAGTSGQTAQLLSQVEQINATYAYGGPGCLWKTIEHTTGIHINDFVELNFIGFERVIDALHGVEVCLPFTVNDSKSHLHLTAGRHHIYGKQALAWWRTRENLGMGDDPQRIQRDQYLMAALVKGIEHSSLIKSPTTMLHVIETLTRHGSVTTDTGLTTFGMLRLGEDLRGISTEHVQFVTVPWTGYAGNAQWVSSAEIPVAGNSNWVQWLQPQANNLFSAISHDTKLPKVTKGKSKTKIKTVKPSLVDVQVLNGTQTSNLAATTATSLTTRGFNVIGTPSDAPPGTYTKTVIEYRNAAELPAAHTLAQLFRHVRLKKDSQLTGTSLTLILGSTFTTLAAPTGNSAISNLAGTYGGITANTNICHDSSAFAGPDS